MKKILIIYTLLSSLFVQADPGAILQQAERAYDSKKYTEAIKRYEDLIADGYNSYQLYFNLGNAYYRDNQLGKAIYNYERARKLVQTDEDVNINLGIASSKTIDKIDSRENFFISAVKSSLLTSLSTTAWAWLSVISLGIACIAFYFFKAAQSPVFRRFSFIVSAFFAISFLLAYFFGNSALQARYNNKFAIITAKEAPALNEPIERAKIKFTLHEGTKIRVIEANSNWVLIKLDNGNEGWLQLSEVGII